MFMRCYPLCPSNHRTTCATTASVRPPASLEHRDAALPSPLPPRPSQAILAAALRTCARAIAGAVHPYGPSFLLRPLDVPRPLGVGGCFLGLPPLAAAPVCGT